MSADNARRVAADLLRQAGDEQGARVLERAAECVHFGKVLLDHSPHPHLQQERWDHVAYLDPEWAKAEVERAYFEALKMHEAWKTAGPELDRWADRASRDTDQRSGHLVDAAGYLYRVYGGT